MIVCYYHGMYELQSQSKIYSLPEFQRNSLLKAGAISEV